MFSPLLQPLLQPLMRGPMEPSGRTLIQRAIAVLRRFGTDAHVYLPGVGMLNGLQAGNYLDSAGTTPGTVDQPVGLVLDAAGGLGVELVTNGDFSNGLTGYLQNAPGYWSVAAGRAYHPFSPDYKGLSQNFSGKAAGPTYRISFSQQVVSGTAQWFYVNAAGVVATKNVSNTNPTTEFVFSDGIQLIGFSRATGGAEFYIDDLSVREVTGIHASQPTTASKPILRQVGGRYSWEFDGSNDSLSLGGPLFQMADDHCVVAGFNGESFANSPDVFSHASTANANALIKLGATSGNFPSATWRDDSGGLIGLDYSGYGDIRGRTVVTALRKLGGVRSFWVDGVQRGSAVTNVGVTTLNTAAIGVRPTSTLANYFTGSIHPAVAIKGAVSDDDLLLLKKLVAQLSGETI